MSTKKTEDWVATVTIQSSGAYNVGERLRFMSDTISGSIKRMSGDGVILFPGGWLNAEQKPASSLYNQAEKTVTEALKSAGNRKIFVVFGIDGSDSADQIAVAIDKKGIQAIGRKFYPIDDERDYLKAAKSYDVQESGKSRVFELNKRKFFMAVCYDIFGIKHKNLPNKFKANVILNLVHRFDREEFSGFTQYARHGFAGASNHWHCPVFGTAVFFEQKIPVKWPTGVYWDQGSTRQSECNYKNITIPAFKKIKGRTKEGEFIIRFYHFDKYLLS